MMKNRFTVLMMLALAMVLQLASCKDDEFTATIFDTNDYPLDRTQYTFPLDSFVKANFLEPYNMKFIYRMEYTGSDKDKNLTPASYDNSCKLAVLTKYLWHDVYKQAAADKEVFLKKYSPRIIHVIGSKNLNTSSGTETLGVTEGGTKVTLYRVNLLDPGDIDNMNEYFFETMHHEFGHILDNNKLHPTTFNLLSNGLYNSSSWNETPDSVAASQGFVTPYASMSYTEDWVETFGRYITRDSVAWKRMLETAEYEWELIDLPDFNKDDDIDEKDYDAMLKSTYAIDIDTIGYLKVDESGNDKHKIYRRMCERDQNDNVVNYQSDLSTKALYGDTDEQVERQVYSQSGDAVLSATYTASAATYCLSYEKYDAFDVSKFDELQILLPRPTVGSWKVSYRLDNGKKQTVDFGTASSFILNLRGYSELHDLKIIADKGANASEPISSTNQAVISIDRLNFVKYQPKWTPNAVGARQVIEQKVEFVREYMKTQYGIDLDELRDMIQSRQFLKGPDGRYLTETYYNPATFRTEERQLNAITHVDPETGKSVLDDLLYELEKIKKFQIVK
ncbi:MAG: hypothetical protein IJ144_04855 [Prevotella sp.]|nr:hypothetical protein [Prevotella sp.]MBQ9187140.1 hypothetical protein [Prevotella sp.]